jgi:peptidoglycan/xylan/chitin deacetylase (PgdA/CDA1 family)
MSMPQPIPDWYQWKYRPQKIERPAWFRSWPEQGRVAICFKLMHEWESVPRPAGRVGAGTGTANVRDYFALGAREYGFKEGIWRLMDILDKHGVKVTVMASGLAVDLWPESFRELHKRGHEIASHGWDQCLHPPQMKSREEEHDAIRKTLAVIEKVTGKRPRGHMSQGPRPTEHTPELVAEEGLIWDADYQDCDIPYIMNVNGRKVVSVGYAKPDFTDNDIAPLGLAGGLRQLTDQFDAVYEESAQHPMKFFYAMHVHKVGTPGMAKMLDKFIEHVKRHDKVWFGRCGDIADYWLANEKS